MGYYDTMQVCLRGHKITSKASRAEFRETFCQKCGAATTLQCPDCKTNIRGRYESKNVIDLTPDRTKVPLNCHGCGKAYPWRKKVILHGYLKKPKWLKPFSIWVGKNLVKVVTAVSIAVLTAVILYKLKVPK